MEKSQPKKDAQPRTQVIRDAQGNRRRISRGRASSKTPRDLQVMIEIYGIRDDLAERVLAGEMNLLTARSLQRRRTGAKRKPTGPLKKLLSLFS